MDWSSSGCIDGVCQGAPISPQWWAFCMVALGGSWCQDACKFTPEVSVYCMSSFVWVSLSRQLAQSSVPKMIRSKILGNCIYTLYCSCAKRSNDDVCSDLDAWRLGGSRQSWILHRSICWLSTIPTWADIFRGDVEILMNSLLRGS